MSWKAWLDGHAFDLETLSELFREGDPHVAQDQSDEYYLESPALQDPNGQPDLNAAEALVTRINGAARAVDQGFRPVHLKGRYTAPDGRTNVVISADTIEVRSKAKATGYQYQSTQK